MSFPNDPMEGEKFLTLRRPCSCTCACIGRPDLEVYFVEGDGKERLLGYILHPWTLCAQEVTVQDSHKNTIFNVEAACSQLGLMCRACPCESCQLVHFDIKSPDGSQNLANLDRKSAGCCRSAAFQGDNFYVEFPTSFSKEQRALLFATVIFLDIRFFAENNETPANVAVSLDN